MEWNHIELQGLALADCKNCGGTGMRGWRNHPQPCRCVLRNVFRVCYHRFRHCVEQDRTISRVSQSFSSGGKDHRRRYERLVEDYIADFTLVSRRYLDEFEYKLFRFHFLLGADWRLCCRQLRVDKGTFFHAIYRIQQRLGRVFSEIQPFALYPVEEYFTCHIPDEGPRGKVVPMPDPADRRRRPLRPPVTVKVKEVA